MPSVSFMNSVFGQSMPSGALDHFNHSSINLGSFPSLPAGSGLDFDHFMQQSHGGDHVAGPGMQPSPFQAMSRIGSLGMGKLESMELPDTVAHLLHDMPPDQRDQAGMQRSNSGLESMQSIEQALGNVDDNGTEKLADDNHDYWMSAQQGSSPPPKVKMSS